MQHHILYLAGLDRPRGTDPRTLARYEARAHVERANAVHDAFAAFGRAVAAVARGVARTVSRRRAARATIRRLQALDDRTLADIGVHRGGITAVAWATVDGETRPGRAPEAVTAGARPDGAAAAQAPAPRRAA